MSLELLLLFSAVFAVDSLTPGPSTMMVMVRGATQSTLRVVPLILGFVVAELLLFALAIAGLMALVATLGPLFWVVKWLGVAYLLYFAYSLWTSDPTPPAVQQAAPRAWVKELAIGVVLPLGNPQAIGFYVAILPLVVDATALTLGEALVIGSIISGIWFTALIAYAVAGAQISRRLNGPRAFRIMTRSSAGAMVGMAGVAATR